ncbi:MULTISPECIES: ABC transporter ATP-binding protein [Streptomycetaceae]|uniref:ABC transport system ATP-binding protein n=1 Tax=Streptantibioticus cattleyicolor (strain ATCC 35852 / DSM 46488 / JCM 4925 / NBRC 14057 / NRRL 8057) TaxID=1003195 RepID=F8JWR8_STREN|nr:MULTISPECIES: ABC transporter ATP-binding protein [Streptomycetaceae]AEW97069.1 ABC transport system ATP-binding protein [Streptantibioticus cattleyicolor NRRL 8057 = DSM 46488]MYS61532.1 ATP-binding cassette domain-containing protein [Streptomyces sp. SID5468]CCB77393.1 ABC transport system ATP-binding protein [Streptantibioticus cattleyicolor NRRL 8057 = DSM 46488]
MTATNASAPLRLAGVRLTYPDGERRLTALDGVSLTVDAGELVAVAGPSGSGKSSLLAVAATLLTPDAGQVTVAGRETGRLRPAERAALRREHIGIVFQQANLLPALTAVEQLLVVEHLRGRRPRAARERAEELLDSVGLDAAKRARRPHQLSGGERQRVNIARALFTGPSVLLVDEPTSALDRERGAHVMELLAEVTAVHRTATVLVTHDTGLLERAGRVVWMRDGRLDGQRSGGGRTAP